MVGERTAHRRRVFGPEPEPNGRRRAGDQNHSILRFSARAR
jgi:hypothetical protein